MQKARKRWPFRETIGQLEEDSLL